jgi:hypothetical protein
MLGRFKQSYDLNLNLIPLSEAFKFKIINNVTDAHCFYNARGKIRNSVQSIIN